MQKSILIINGPGLGDMEQGDNDHYDGITLSKIRAACEEACNELGVNMDFRQTDDQEELFTWIAKSSAEADGVVVNPVGYSRAEDLDFGIYRGAVQMLGKLKKPVIEVHLRNIYSHGADVTRPLHEPGGDMGFISGFGEDGYVLAIRSLAEKINA